MIPASHDARSSGSIYFTLNRRMIQDHFKQTQGKRIKEWNEQQERHKARQSGAGGNGQHCL
jgi:type IV secretory pathway VirD2 relaxase